MFKHPASGKERRGPIFWRFRGANQSLSLSHMLKSSVGAVTVRGDFLPTRFFGTTERKNVTPVNWAEYDVPLNLCVNKKYYK